MDRRSFSKRLTVLEYASSAFEVGFLDDDGAVLVRGQRMTLEAFQRRYPLGTLIQFVDDDVPYDVQQRWARYQEELGRMTMRDMNKRLSELEQRSGQRVFAAYYPGLDWRMPDAPPVGYVRICDPSKAIMPLEEFRRRYPHGTVVHIEFVTDWRGEDRHDG
jgi:hypothetical protein